jgi:hypothetical protein
MTTAVPGLDGLAWWAVLGFALVLVLALGASIFITVQWSVYRSIRATRRDRVRPAVREAMLDQLFSETPPDWAAWVATLSRPERDVAETLLAEYLRELDGAEADRLRGLGMALGIPARAGRRLRRADEFDRLEALTWLTLLREPAPYLEADVEPTTARERAAVVTLLLETEQLPDAETGLSLLLDGVTGQFTVFGQQALYRVATLDPEPLLRRARQEYRTWPEPLLAQVLAVCAELETSIADGDLGWLTAALETENEAIRAAAARTLGRFGWRAALRDEVFIERTSRDPSPRVRIAVYRMLAEWGDDRALWSLLYALVEEEDPLALTRGTAALVRHDDRFDVDIASVFGDAYHWSTAHARFDRLAKQAPPQPVRE